MKETRLERVSSDGDVTFKAKGKAGPQAQRRHCIERAADSAELVTVEAPGRPASPGWGAQGRHTASARAPSAQPALLRSGQSGPDRCRAGPLFTVHGSVLFTIITNHTLSGKSMTGKGVHQNFPQLHLLKGNLY